MKKNISLFWLILSLFLVSSCSDIINLPNPETIQETEIVYVTKTGDKYHRSNCRYLSNSKISIEKDEAIKQGYTACSVCKP